MNTIQALISEVATARKEYLAQIQSVTETQAGWKPSDDGWSITDITEHLFWAEQGALCGMWKTILAIRDGSIPKTYESPHKEMPIEKIIDLTWQSKEKVPAVAAPRLGGSLAFWSASLFSLQGILESFGAELQEDELRVLAHPHPISGPLDFQQRIEFLRFHIERHGQQVSALIENIKNK